MMVSRKGRKRCLWWRAIGANVNTRTLTQIIGGLDGSLDAEPQHRLELAPAYNLGAFCIVRRRIFLRLPKFIQRLLSFP